MMAREECFIPEDLRKQYEIALRNYSCVMANGSYIALLIERIAALEAQVAELKIIAGASEHIIGKG